MDHVAIMKKSWGLVDKIANGKKTIESRWYKYRHKPWNSIGPGDRIFFKNSGEPVSLQAEVAEVKQFSNLNPKLVKELLSKYKREDGIEGKDFDKFYELFREKKYCMLIFLKHVKKISSFNIDKTGFGAMSAWISVNDISKLVSHKFEISKLVSRVAQNK